MTADARPVLVAPDSFKGTLSAPQVAMAIGQGLDRAGVIGDLAPAADGGEGTQEVLLGRLGGEASRARVHDPLGREIDAELALLADGHTAIVEAAKASGLGLLAPDERDAEATSSDGTGELIAAAVLAGAARITVCVGGTASTDGGAGAIDALQQAGGLRGAHLTVLCDVRTPFELAAERFAPQKGADAAAIRRLRTRLERLATRLPRNPCGEAGTGAGGGLAGGLWAAFGADLRPGAPFVLDALGFDRRLRSARAVIVGEGTLDRTTLEGKVAYEAAMRARQIGVPAHAIVGANALGHFDARILDLQEIIEAQSLSAIARAAEELARRAW